MAEVERYLVDGVGLWRGLSDPEREIAAGPALFLDRDGVLIEDPGYLHQPARVALIPGAAALVAACNRAGVPVVVVTNQSGIGRGYYGWPDFVAVQSRLEMLLGAAEARLDMVLACAYHADGVGQFAVAEHAWRKPNPGMLRAAAEIAPIDLARSWLIGDRASDLAAARAAGLAGGLCLAGHDEAAVEALGNADFTVLTAPSMKQARAVLARLESDG